MGDDWTDEILKECEEKLQKLKESGPSDDNFYVELESIIDGLERLMG